MDLTGLTIVQLLEEHNRLAPKDGRLSTWKGSKELLVERLEALRSAARRPQRTIKQASYEMLLLHDQDDHTGRSMGLSYEEILRRLREEFPDCETTDKCLRWYAVQLNTDGAKLPGRPRKPPARRKKGEK